MGSKYFALCLAGTAGVGAIVGMLGLRLAQPQSAEIAPQAQVETLRADFRRLEDIISVAHLVVEAELVDERVDAVIVPSADGSPPIVRSDLVRTFQVLQVLDGTFEEHTIEVRSTQELQMPGIGPSIGPVSDRTSVVSLERHRRYILFLSKLTDIVGPVWGMQMEPGVAEVDGGDLLFRGSTEHAKAVAASENGSGGVDRRLERVSRQALIETIRTVRSRN